MNSDLYSIDERRARAGAGNALRGVGCGVTVFVVVALLLNASALQRNASLMEYGLMRDTCLAVIKPIAAVSCFLGLDRPRAFVEGFRISEGV